MRNIPKSDEPVFWTDFKRKNKIKAYKKLDDFKDGPALRRKLKNHLILEQNGLCCYCCSRITEDSSHNEHFLPQNSYPQKSMDYANIFCSCNAKETCGSKKGHSTETIISPSDNPEEHFEYLYDGTIKAKDKDIIGEETIKVLNLNHTILKKRRENILSSFIQNLLDYDDTKEIIRHYTEPDEKGQLHPCCNIIDYFIKKGIADRKILQDNWKHPYA